MNVVQRIILILALALSAGVTPAQGDTGNEEKTYRLGVVVFEGFELLDIMGPLEMFGNVGKRLEIVMIAEKAGEVSSAQKVKTVADYSFKNCPKLDLILVPGGRGTGLFVKNEASMKWLQQRSAEVDIVASVCNGSDILAQAGLLDGYDATTNKMAFSLISARSPGVNWVRKARWVDDGDRITSSGVSAGIDMSLHVIERLFGEKSALMIAYRTEYEWHRDPNWDPFAEPRRNR